jgi:hypothetical protein
LLPRLLPPSLMLAMTDWRRKRANRRS